MTIDFLQKFADALGEIYQRQKYSHPILIARDTRSSGIIIEDLLSSVLNFKGINVELAGVLPTPALSKLMQLGDFSFGVMISASHNPHHDNGIKMFGANGFKLESCIEAEIEEIILLEKTNQIAIGKELGIKSRLERGFIQYTDKILEKFQSIEVKDEILIDCSNGAYSEISERFLDNHPKLSFINDNPDGDNINFNCGALEKETLIKEIKLKDYKYGVAFDGDGDRAIFVSSDYGAIQTEKIMFLFFKMLKERYKNNILVTTEVCNLALKHNIEDQGGTLIDTEVGDRFVVNETTNKAALFGAEPSGHFYFPEISNAMDGLIALLYFLQLLEFYGSRFNAELLSIKHYQRIQKNISLDQIKELNLDHIMKNISLLINSQKEKIIVRQSMWDPVLRVYYDYQEENNFSNIEKELKLLLH